MSENASEFVKVKATYNSDMVIILKSSDFQDLYDKSFYGSDISDQEVELDPFETLFLLERDRIEVFSYNNELISSELLLKDFSAKKEMFWIKFLVYRDLRSRGYIVRQAFGENMDLRVFPRGSKRNSTEARFFVSVLAEGHPIRLQLFNTISDDALRARKQLIIAIVDRLGDITYYQMEHTHLQANTERENLI